MEKSSLEVFDAVVGHLLHRDTFGKIRQVEGKDQMPGDDTESFCWFHLPFFFVFCFALRKGVSCGRIEMETQKSCCDVITTTFYCFKI
jgi:hypothetical protein